MNVTIEMVEGDVTAAQFPELQAHHAMALGSDVVLLDPNVALPEQLVDDNAKELVEEEVPQLLFDE